jgi:very-short-patch-repair endonuclease
MNRISQDKIDKIVLVGVLRNKRDLNILLTENWYRIPVSHAPRRRFDYLAFYQPLLFCHQGKRIRYYARVLNYQIIKRGDLLPNEPNHVRAHDYYLQLRVGKIKKLSRPIRNIIPRRVSFGFTTLKRLLKSKNILELYNVAPTEQIMEDGLRRAGIKAIAQHYVLSGKKRYCLDFAVFCKQGAIAIECDNKKAHSSLRQQEKDKIKNTFLRRRGGWIVIRLPEHDIVSDLKGCIVRVKKAVRKLGGLKEKSKTKNWSKYVTEHSFALELEEGVFTWDDPRKIAASLKKSAEESLRRKGTPFQSAMSMLNFYINRAGKNLKPARKKILEQAKIELRINFHVL